MGDESARIQAKVERAEAMISALEIKLAGVAPSERSLTDIRDHERLLAELAKYRDEHTRILSGDQYSDDDNMQFVNRERELEQLSRPTCPQYLAIEAPAGFGKTVLLRRLQSILNDRASEAICLYAALPVRESEPSQIEFIGLQDSVICSGELGGNQILLNVVELATRPGQNEVIIIFDNMENIASSTSASDALWRQFVMAAERRLHGDSCFSSVVLREKGAIYMAGRNAPQAPVHDARAISYTRGGRSGPAVRHIRAKTSPYL